MPRRPRDDHAGAWHHVMNRGAGRQAIFEDDTDRRRFLIELREACRGAGVEIACYCLLSNHYHLVLHTPGGGLSGVMQRLSSAYTRTFNARHGRDGPLFRGRFTSVRIENSAQLVQATVYVHRNPVAAGLVQVAAAWPWSSAASYVGLAPAPEWLSAGGILSMMGVSEPSPAYATLLAECPSNGVNGVRHPGST